MYRIMAITKDRLKGMYLPIRFADYDLAMKYVSELVELNASFGIDHLDYEIEEASNDTDIQIQKSLERLLVASQERMQESLRSLTESTNKLSKEFEAFKTRAEQPEEDKGKETNMAKKEKN